MFTTLKNIFTALYTTLSSQLSSLFSSARVDEHTLQELRRILLEADAGVAVTKSLIAELETDVKKGAIVAGADLKKALYDKLLARAQHVRYDGDTPVIIMVGINGSGKTTTVAKMAARLKKEGNKVLLVAGDTFRAAATEQLRVWADTVGVAIVIGKENQDPASVIFTACEKYKKEGYDRLLIDTAGRLQTKVNLMKELEKIGKIVARHLPETRITTLLTVDSMLGQNSFDQAKLFNESTKLDGIVLTKLDGTGKGGIIFAIMQALNVPVAYVTFGEQIDQIRPFDPQDYVNSLVNS